MNKIKRIGKINNKKNILRHEFSDFEKRRMTFNNKCITKIGVFLDMKKNYFLIAALLALVVILPSTLKATTEKTVEYVTVYWCDPGQTDCITHSNGNMSITILGILRMKTIPRPSVYVPPPSGYSEYEHYFCHDPNNNSIGNGVINGFLHYKDNNSDIFAYKCKESTIYTNFNEWQNALP